MNDLDMSTQARARRALAVPILRFLEIAPLDEKDMTKGMSFTLTSAALNAVGGAHAGALATVLGVAAYLAIVGELAAEEEAITHTFHASYVAPIPPGSRIECRAEVIRRGARVAFVSAELRADNEVVATATVTKAIRRSQ